jgi:integrase
MASRVLQRVSAVFRYAISTGRATHNPAADLVGSLKTRKVTHRSALSRAELPEFLMKLNVYDGQPLTRLALKLVVLTFVPANCAGHTGRRLTSTGRNGAYRPNA